MELRSKLLLPAITLGAAVSLIGGGFGLDIGKPAANPEAQAIHAVLMVRAMACVEQEKTTVTGTAEGMVNGKRETLPLKMMPLSEQGAFAVRQQWPDKGKWVLIFVAEHPRFGERGAIVQLDAGRVDWARITYLDHAPAKQEVAAVLNTTVAAAR